MEIRKITENKRNFMELLLLADEQEDMIDKYLDRGAMFAFYEHCGFTYFHRLEGYFTEHYREPIFEDGVQLVDKVYYQATL